LGETFQSLFKNQASVVFKNLIPIAFWDVRELKTKTKTKTKMKGKWGG
jgi:hypothetical protein